MPVIGLGTGGYGSAAGGGEWWNDTVAETAVLQWLQLGGRRIDSAISYKDYVGAGRAMRASGVPRDQIFVTSKIDYPYGYDNTIAQVKTVLEGMQMDYVDLMLMHWPGTTCKPAGNCSFGAGCRQDTWRALETVFKQGQARAIGVSNFEINHLQDIIELGGLLPAVNQFEQHPYWQQPDLVAFCRSLNITVNSYSPLGAPDHMPSKGTWPVHIMAQPAVVETAQAVGRTVAQTLLRWHMQQGFVTNPRTMSAEHMQQNLNVFDFELSEQQMAAISNVPRPIRPKVCADPALYP